MKPLLRKALGVAFLLTLFVICLVAAVLLALFLVLLDWLEGV